MSAAAMALHTPNPKTRGRLKVRSLIRRDKDTSRTRLYTKWQAVTYKHHAVHWIHEHQNQPHSPVAATACPSSVNVMWCQSHNYYWTTSEKRNGFNKRRLTFYITTGKRFKVKSSIVVRKLKAFAWGCSSGCVCGYVHSRLPFFRTCHIPACMAKAAENDFVQIVTARFSSNNHEAALPPSPLLLLDCLT